MKVVGKVDRGGGAHLRGLHLGLYPDSNDVVPPPVKGEQWSSATGFIQNSASHLVLDELRKVHVLRAEDEREQGHVAEMTGAIWETAPPGSRSLQCHPSTSLLLLKSPGHARIP